MTELTAATATQAKNVPDRANQDAVMAKIETTSDGTAYGWFILADGAGGHEDGDQASHMALETIAGQMENASAELTFPLNEAQKAALKARLSAAIMAAHEEILAYGDAHDIRAATTVTCVFVYGRTALVGNVGDSRTYLFHQNLLEQITEDHSLVMWLVKQGHIAAGESRNHPYGNVLLHALGSPETPQIDITLLQLEENDCLLLCSDGIWSMLTDEELAGHLQTAVSPEEAANKIMAAVEPIHKDDFSLIVVKT